jgi:hypothetical protein
VCAANDTTTAATGSIPAIPTPNFGSDPAITAALQGFAAEFAAYLQGSGCIFSRNGGDQGFITAAEVQFCDQVNAAQAFPQGDSLLTVQVVGANGTPGPTKQIVVRVATWTPRPTPTP